MKDEERSENNKKKKVFSLEKSSEIVESIKAKKLLELFKFLDSDHDGYISKNKINISNIDVEILEIFAPLLYDMERKGLNLDFETFYDASLILFKVYNNFDFNLLLIFYFKSS